MHSRVKITDGESPDGKRQRNEVAIHGQKSWNGVMIISKYPLQMLWAYRTMVMRINLIDCSDSRDDSESVFWGQTADSEKFAFRRFCD